MTEFPALSVENLTFRYRTREDKALRNVSLAVQPGEFILIAGASGCGKTTLARCMNGLIPHSYKGELEGKIHLFGEDIAEMGLAAISQKIGTLIQDPERQIVASDVLSEVAFGPENLGLPAEEIMERVNRALERLRISHLLRRETFALSGGEKQKVALAGVLAMRPTILLLDEPLASLDSASAHEAVQLFRRLADEGTTVLMIEHRVEDGLMANPDRLLYMEDGEIRYLGPVQEPPREISYQQVKLPAAWVVERIRQEGAPASPATLEEAAPLEKDEGVPLVVFEDVTFGYEKGRTVLEHINLTIREGDLIAVLGPNGAGKSTLVKHTIGLLKPTSGRVLIEGKDSRKVSIAANAHSVGYVFQNPTHMLFANSVNDELAFGPQNLGFSQAEVEKNTLESVQVLNLTGLEEFPPLGLSFGQQKRTTIAAVLAMRSKILIMDEPTAGQDYANYTRFMTAMCDPADSGRRSLLAENFKATLFITHDLDLAVTYANRIVLVGEKRILADGKPEEVLRDYDLLARGRVRPTSLLQLNEKWLPNTRRFLPVEKLARFIVAQPA